MDLAWLGSVIHTVTALSVTLFMFLYILCENANADSSQTPPTLVLLQLLFRHGDRSPTEPYPGDPNNALWPQGFGQLTKVGMNQAFQYGQKLRERYSDFLPAQYNRKQVYVQSTDVDRTIMTAQTLLTGLFPTNMMDWPPGVWQPVPVHNQVHYEDQLFAHAPCPRAENLKHQWTNNSIPAAKRLPQYEKLLHTLAKHANITTLDELHQLSDTIFCEAVHNMTLPDWLTDDFYKQLMDFRDDATQFTFIAPGTARLFGGPLLAEMTKNMDSWTQNASDYKLFLFSAHDMNVISLGRAMGILNELQPPYLTSILLELHQIGQQFFVKVVFDNHTDHSPFDMSIDGCEVMCPLEKFRELLQHNMLSAADREAACAIPSISRDTLVIFLAAIVMVLAVAVSCVTFLTFRARQLRSRTSANLRYQQLLQNTAAEDSDDDYDQAPVGGL